MTAPSTHPSSDPPFRARSAVAIFLSALLFLGSLQSASCIADDIGVTTSSIQLQAQSAQEPGGSADMMSHCCQCLCHAPMQSLAVDNVDPRDLPPARHDTLSDHAPLARDGLRPFKPPRLAA